MTSSPSNGSEHDGSLGTDSIATGIAFVISVSIIQRGIGFIRTALFCRLLPEHELGQWSLALSFLMLCAPLTMFGITGSFGRYVEHYRGRSLLRMFLVRTATVVTSLGVVAISLVCLGQAQLAWLVFGTSDQFTLIVCLAITLGTVLVYNYFLEVFVALRRPRVGSTMELIVSGTFAVLGLISIHFQTGSAGLILSFAVGNAFGALYALHRFIPIWRRLPHVPTAPKHSELWSKLAPYAAGLWLINIVANLFDMVDRYMILHFSPVDAITAQGMVGQYFSSLTFPLLMVAISNLLAHLVLPYFSSDWEAGHHADVSARLNLALKLLGMCLLTGAVCLILVGPFIFDFVFGSKFDDGFAVLPWTVTFCFWNGMVVMAANYLYCCERTRLSCISLVAGLTTNIVLNAALLPFFGLHGAAAATACGSLLNLLLVFTFSARLGMQFDRRILAITFAPIVLWFGPNAAAVALVVLLGLCLRSSLIFSSAERAMVDTALTTQLEKLNLRGTSPAT